MNFDEMPAGREMDALVAKHVMGFQEVGECLVLGGDLVVGRWDPPYVRGPDGFVRACRHYSTDWDALEDMVNKLLEYAYPFELHWRGPRGDDSWSCYVGDVGYAGTAPLAICRGVLKRVERLNDRGPI